MLIAFIIQSFQKLLVSVFSKIAPPTLYGQPYANAKSWGMQLPCLEFECRIMLLINFLLALFVMILVS